MKWKSSIRKNIAIERRKTMKGDHSLKSIKKRMLIGKKVFVLLMIVSLILGGFPPLQTNAAGLIKVNTLKDLADTPGCANGGECSLRGAIKYANSNGGGTIELPTGNYNLTLLGRDEDQAATGDLDITSNITIKGMGTPAETIIDATAINDRVFDINPLLYSPGFDVTLESLTIQNGKVGLYDNVPFGGGLLADTGSKTLTLNQVIITNNTASGDGGGLYISGLPNGKLNILDSSISHNQSAYGNSGGGLFLEGDFSTTINSTTVDSNISGGLGGGLYSQKSAVTVLRSTFSNNQASSSGGGLYLNVPLIMENSTLSGNRANEKGGGIFLDNYAALSSALKNNTITQNSASTDGSGVYVQNGKIELRNSIVAGNGGKDVIGVFLPTSSYNLIGNNPSNFPSTNNKLNVTNPGLKPLADNGGPTKTHALSDDSPAIDAGDSSVSLNGTSDQRGGTFARIVDFMGNDSIAQIDIGAYEANTYLKIAEVADVTMNNSSPKTVDVNVLAPENAPVTLEATSSNTTILPNTNLSITDGTNAKKLTITPIVGKVGTSVITVTAKATINGQVITATKTFQVTITGEPDLKITQTTEGDLKQGDVGTFKLTVKNVGTGPTAKEVKVENSLPSEFTVKSISGTGWNCQSTPTLICSRTDSLESNATYPDILIKATVPEKAPAEVENKAILSSVEDKNEANNTSTTKHSVVQRSDLKVVATVDANVSQGKDAVYKMKVKNDGSGTSNGDITVKANLPDKFTAVSIEGASWSCDKNTLSCISNQSIEVGASSTEITLTASADNDAASPANFQANVSGGDDRNTTNNIAALSTTVNKKPVAQDQTATTVQNTKVSGTITATDPDGDSLSYEINANPSHGTATVAHDGNWGYTPKNGYVGSDSFTILVKDAKGADITVTVSVTINNQTPTLSDFTVKTTQKAKIDGQLAATDPDGDSLVYKKISNPANGTVTVEENGAWSYIPASKFAGTDFFKVEVDDQNGGKATATITINVENVVPVVEDAKVTTEQKKAITRNVVATDAGDDDLTFTYSNPTKGTLTSKQAEWTYTPNAGFVGEDTIIVTVTDPFGGKAEATIQIKVTNVAPTADHQTATTDQLQKVQNKLTAKDEGGDLISFSLNKQATNGKAEVDTEGYWVYTPNTGFAGNDSFEVKIEDSHGGSAVATVVITVKNIAPVLPNEVANTNQKKKVTGKMNGQDAGGDLLKYRLSEQAKNGEASISADGDWSYVSKSGFVGTDLFKVKVSDPNGGETEATVTITVENALPTITDSKLTTILNKTVSGKLTANDQGEDQLTFSKQTDPVSGTVTVESDGKWTYKPNNGFIGEDSFTVQVTDGNGGAVTGKVTITVKKPPPIPVPTPIPEKPIMTENSGENITAVEVSKGTKKEVNGQVVSWHQVDEKMIDQLIQELTRSQNKTAGLLFESSESKSNVVQIEMNKTLVDRLLPYLDMLILQYNGAQIQLSKETLVAIDKQKITFTLRTATDNEQKGTEKLVQKRVKGTKVLGQPIVIETNYAKSTTLLLPLADSLGTLSKEELKRLHAFIQYSDGESKFSKGTIKYAQDGKPIGFIIQVKKFSTFSIVSIPESIFNGIDLPDYTGEVTPTKTWLVKFNTSINQKSVTNETIYLMDDQYNKIAAKLTYKGKEVRIKPIQELEPGIYYLYITNKITSIYGKPMKKNVRMKFIVPDKK